MKRLTAAIMLILIGAVIFASNPISFSGRYALVGSDGRTIRRTSVDVEGTGVVLATGEEKAKAEGSTFSLILGENSLAAIKDEEGLVIYLVFRFLSARCTIFFPFMEQGISILQKSYDFFLLLL